MPLDLPSGEREGDSHAATPTSAASPSPPGGEGAQRAGEGAATGMKGRVSPATLALTRRLRRLATIQEVILWGELRGRRFAGFKFRRQVPIGKYVADFVCLSARLVLEVDGRQHAERASDRERDLELERRGFRVLRVWNSAVNTDRAGVLEAIWAALHGASPSSGASRHLLPQGEKGTEGQSRSAS